MSAASSPFLPLLCIIDELEHSLSSFPRAQSPWTVKNGAPENLLQLPFGCRSQCVRCISLCVHLEVYSGRPSQRPESVIFSTRQPWNQFSASFSAFGNCQSWIFYFFCHISKSCYTRIGPTKNFQKCDYIQTRCQQVPLSNIVALMPSDQELQNLHLAILVFKYIQLTRSWILTGNSLLVWTFQRLKIDILFETKLWVWACMCRHVFQLGIRNSFFFFLSLLRSDCLPNLSWFLCNLCKSSVQKPNEPLCYRSDHNRPRKVIYMPPYWDWPLVMGVKFSSLSVFLIMRPWWCSGVVSLF